MESSNPPKKPRMAGRRLVGVGLGVGTLAVGLFVLADQTWVASLIAPFLGSTPAAGDAASAGLTPYGSLSYVVYAIGFGLVLSGVGLIRSIWSSSVTSYVSGGPSAMGFNPEALQNMMNAGMAQASAITSRSAAAAAPKDVVKLKCRNCGSLEPEDAAFCRKCGQPM